MADATALREKLLAWADEVFTVAVGGDQSLMVQEMREAAPLGETGDTRRGIEAVPGGTPLRLAAHVRSTGKGGDFVEEGTAPHVITPRNATVLRFLGGTGRVSQPSPNQRIATRAGGVVFTKVVHHPGTPPRPWFRPVVERFDEFLQRAAAQVG